MIGHKRTLIVVPARGGSKGVPLKNLRPVGGISLVGRTGMVAAALDWADRSVVSTDHEQIAAEAEASGLAAPFRRPESLGGDRISDLDVLTQALLEMEKQDGCVYDVVIMLQPTCPLRLPAHVTATAKKLVEENLDAVWTVTASDLKMHPLKQLLVDEKGAMQYYDPAGSSIIARQQLTPVYHRNGAAYAITRECLLEKKSIMGTRAGAVIVHDVLVNIDTLEDFVLAESCLQQPG